MTNRRHTPRALAPLFTVALAGCVSTIFESPPGTATSACDTHWVGSWDVHTTDPKAQGDDKLMLRVGAQCKALTIVENGNKQHDLDHTVLIFATIHGRHIAALKLDSETKGTKSSLSDWDTGYHYFSYMATDKEIRLHQADDERVAELLIDGKLFGRTEKITRYPGAKQPADSGTLHNFVAGTPSDMARALQRYPLFSEQERHHIDAYRSRLDESRQENRCKSCTTMTLPQQVRIVEVGAARRPAEREGHRADRSQDRADRQALGDWFARNRGDQLRQSEMDTAAGRRDGRLYGHSQSSPACAIRCWCRICRVMNGRGRSA